MMKKIYICPMAKMVTLANASIMAGSENGNVEAGAGGTTDEVGAKESMWHWMED